MTFWRTQISIEAIDGSEITLFVAGVANLVKVKRYEVGLPDGEIYVGKICHAKVNIGEEDLLFKDWEEK